MLFMALMLLYAKDSLSAAQEAFALWQQTVAPSLLPFFAVLPALTCREATDWYARALKWPCRLLGLPGELGGAAGIAFAAGSPAGARALVRIASRRPLPSDALFRAALLCSGVSPGFVISGVGAGMLGDSGAGAALLAAHLLSLVLSCLLFRLLPLPTAPVARPEPDESAGMAAIPFAVQSALSILGWMMLFAVGARLMQNLLPDVCAPLPPLLAEFSGGCRYAYALNLPREWLLPLLGAVIGFGGVCAGCQNLSALKPLNIPPGMYFSAKAAQAAICALLCRAMCELRLPAPSLKPEHVLPVLAAVCLLPLLGRRRHDSPGKEAARPSR